MSVGAGIRVSFMVLALLATLAQFLIDASVENVASACIVLASALGILLYMHWSRALQTHPLSVFVIFGFCLTTQLGALLVQSLYWTPLRFSLFDAIRTFGTLAFYQAIALAVHVVYVFFSAPPGNRQGWLRRLFANVGLYRMPSTGSLWIFGAIGILGIFLSGRTGIISKFGHGMNFLAWAPFLIPFYGLRSGRDATIAPRQWAYLALYVGVIVCFALATNGRAAIFRGALTVALLYLLDGLRSERPIEARLVVRLAVACLVGAIALQPLSQLVAAMGAARASRGKVPPLELVEKTLDFLVHPELIRESPDADPEAPNYHRAYDEIYLKNSLFGRFVETKFHDNAIHFGAAIVTEDSIRRLRDVTVNSCLAVLPSPLLYLLDIHVDKRTLLFSMGDYLFYLAKGGSLGSFRTGSMFGQGIALMGLLFPVVYAATCLAIFHWLRLLTYADGTGAMALSAVAMMNVWGLFQYGITAESIAGLLGTVARGFPQWVLVYLVAMTCARWALGKGYVAEKTA